MTLKQKKFHVKNLFLFFLYFFFFAVRSGGPPPADDRQVRLDLVQIGP
jgi:hypothetical protein